MTTPLILIIGATGTIGRELVPQLAGRGQRVRVAVRDPGKAAAGFGSGIEILQADLAEPDTLVAACAGADKVFVVSNGPGIRLEPNLYKAAASEGIKHIVRVSALEIEFPELAATPLGQWHLEAEQHLRACGIPWTLLRPSYFASNTRLPFIIDLQAGAFLPSGHGREAPIDPRDIASVGVKVVTEEAHDGEVYLLTGPALLSFSEMTAKVSAVLGKPLKHVDVTEEEARRRFLSLGIPAAFVESLLGHFAATRAGRAYVTDTTSRLLGRAARTFDEWLRDNAAILKEGL
ncbi:SDR family oxidoreductase [Dongia deserti]|uniref:SDR family oxidoreductase n=1 Tax=Dongia deserti TaxID=2268030 RepID=UPI000E64E02A|nr:SDR family oxidoreductase [Dongia deserti]